MRPQHRDHLLCDASDVSARASALDGLILAVTRAHFTPVPDSTVFETATRLLDEALADYERPELSHSLKRLEDSGLIRRDRSGRIVPPGGNRSPSQVARAFEVAREWASAAAESEPPRGIEVQNASLRRALSHGLLTRREEIKLARRAGRGDRQAITDLVANNTRLAWSQTKSYAWASTAALDREDLFQEACLGLIRAAEKFDPSRGFRFSTYAVAWINQAARRAQANLSRVIRLPVHVFEEVRRVQAVVRNHVSRFGIEPDPSEIARLLGITQAEVVRLLTISQPIASLDADPQLLRPLERPPVEENGPLSEADLIEMLDQLGERERLVVQLRFGLAGHREHTLDAVGRLLGVTRERVRQIQSNALEQIRPHVVEALRYD